jgi:mitogen-activated protein kinase kinase 1
VLLKDLLVNRAGQVKIADFGVSGQMQNTIGQKQTFVGTCTFMSPERILGNTYNSNADIWSLGLTLLQCALGRYPYEKCDTFFALLELIQSSPAPSLPADAPYSSVCADFIGQCLLKDPEQRPSAAALLEHEFITKVAADDVDLSQWLANLVNK